MSVASPVSMESQPTFPLLFGKPEPHPPNPLGSPVSLPPSALCPGTCLVSTSTSQP